MPAPDVVETDRLRLVRWTAEHGAMLARLAALPEITRFLGDGAVWSPERVDSVVARVLRHWDDHGFGWRAAVERESGELIGPAALSLTGAESGLPAGEYEIGWWIDPRFQRRGYAREAARAITDEAFELHAAPSVVARIQPGNAASIAVAESLGLRREGSGTGTFGETFDVFRLARPGGG